MLKIDFLNKKNGGGFEIEKGVGWQFCVLESCFKNYHNETCFKGGVFVFANEWLTFRALDDRNTIYEVKLSAAEAGEIRFWASDKKSLFNDGPLREYKKDNGEIEIAAFLKDKNKQEKIIICEKSVRFPDSRPYTQTLAMETDRSSDLLRFYVTVAYRTESEEELTESISSKKIRNRIKTMTLDNEVTFDFDNHSFMEIMKKIEIYCARRNLTLSFCRKDYMLPSIGVDIPNTVVTSDNFEIMFEFEEVSMVCVAKSIMNSTSYTDTSGAEYSIGNIVRETRKGKNGHIFINEYGAADMCKEVYPEENKYIFGCWFY